MGLGHTSAFKLMMKVAQEARENCSSTLLIGQKVRRHTTYSIHPRFSQPCVGGETRKYASTHGGFATRPEEKPTDLYDPFPEHGMIKGIAFTVCAVQNKKLFDIFFGDESPFIRGFGSKINISVSHGKKCVIGIGQHHMVIDPTVMINLIQIWRSINDSGDTKNLFNKFREAGFKDREIALVAYYDSLANSIRIPQGNYYHPSLLSFRRFLNADPHDLTGGTYGDGYDYNRRDIQDLFYEKNGTDVDILWRELGLPTFSSIWDYKTHSVINKGRNPTDEEFIEAWRKIIDHALATEPEYENVKFKAPAPKIPKLVTKYVTSPFTPKTETPYDGQPDNQESDGEDDYYSDDYEDEEDGE